MCPETVSGVILEVAQASLSLDFDKLLIIRQLTKKLLFFLQANIGLEELLAAFMLGDIDYTSKTVKNSRSSHTLVSVRLLP